MAATGRWDADLCPLTTATVVSGCSMCGGLGGWFFIPGKEPCGAPGASVLSWVHLTWVADVVLRWQEERAVLFSRVMCIGQLVVHPVSLLVGTLGWQSLCDWAWRVAVGIAPAFILLWGAAQNPSHALSLLCALKTQTWREEVTCLRSQS